MRTIYVFLIALIVFPSVVLALSADYDGDGQGEFFKTSTIEHQVGNLSGNSEVQSYKIISESALADATLTGSGILALVAAIWLYSKDVKIIGVGLYISIVAGLWTASIGFITPITNYPVVRGLVSVILVCIGVIATITIAEMVSGGGGGN